MNFIVLPGKEGFLNLDNVSHVQEYGTRLLFIGIGSSDDGHPLLITELAITDYPEWCQEFLSWLASQSLSFEDWRGKCARRAGCPQD